MSIVLNAEFWSAKGQNPCVRLAAAAMGPDQYEQSAQQVVGAKNNAGIMGPCSDGGENLMRICCEMNKENLSFRRFFSAQQ